MSVEATGLGLGGYARPHALLGRCYHAHAVAVMIAATDPQRMVFRVQQQGGAWSVRLGKDTWGEYPARRQALKSSCRSGA
jgi:hypothetical protein